MRRLALRGVAAGVILATLVVAGFVVLDSLDDLRLPQMRNADGEQLEDTVVHAEQIVPGEATTGSVTLRVNAAMHGGHEDVAQAQLILRSVPTSSGSDAAALMRLRPADPEQIELIDGSSSPGILDEAVVVLGTLAHASPTVRFWPRCPETDHPCDIEWHYEIRPLAVASSGPAEVTWRLDARAFFRSSYTIVAPPKGAEMDLVVEPAPMAPLAPREAERYPLASLAEADGDSTRVSFPLTSEAVYVIAENRYNERPQHGNQLEMDRKRYMQVGSNDYVVWRADPADLVCDDTVGECAVEVSVPPWAEGVAWVDSRTLESLAPSGA
jgi:hypothetical protein